MKKALIILATAALSFYSCSKDNLDDQAENSTATNVIFNLTATHPTPATKAVKADWENGDVIFVFFDNAAAPRYLKMSYDGTEWTNTQMNGTTEESLGLAEGATGTMRAVYLPFGNNASVSASGANFVFSETYYSYYLTATLTYKVISGRVSGCFDMQIPDDFVQFFIEDGSAANGTYTLGIDAVIPVGIASIASDCSITEKTDKEAKDDLPGYAYSGGLIFSGKLVSTYNDTYKTTYVIGGDPIEGPCYYFAKIKLSDGSRADYFVSGKTISNHKAYKLPSNDNSKWLAVGADKTVSLSKDATSLGTWHTCNYECSIPEQPGKADVESGFPQYGESPVHSLPSFPVFENLVTKCPRTWISIHGHHGFVFNADDGFIFLPAGAPNDDQINYWTNTWWSGSTYRTVHFAKNGYYELYRGSAERYARYITL